MELGDADAQRLQLLGQFYDPRTSAFLEAAGVGPGDSAVDIGCGHGGVTDRIAARVGDSGTVYAVDASTEQLQVARKTLAHRPNVRFVERNLEDDPLDGQRVDWVYSRFLLMHVRDVRRAVASMADMVADGGALLLEVADVGSLRFWPAHADSGLWREWWYALGRARGLSFDVADRIEDLLAEVGLAIHRKDRYQPIASSVEAKLVHVLGFEQCAAAYHGEIGVPAKEIELHRHYLDRVLHDPKVAISLFENVQYVARRHR